MSPRVPLRKIPVEARKRMAKVKAQSGLDFTLHDLRGTFATVAQSLDVPAHTLKRLIHHRVGGDGIASYVVYDVERLRGPVQRITDHLLALCTVNQ